LKRLKFLCCILLVTSCARAQVRAKEREFSHWPQIKAAEPIPAQILSATIHSQHGQMLVARKAGGDVVQLVRTLPCHGCSICLLAFRSLVGEYGGGSDEEPPNAQDLPRQTPQENQDFTSAGATWTLVPALFDSKGRVRRDHVMVEGRDEVHAEGSYYLEWWERRHDGIAKPPVPMVRRRRQGTGEAGRTGRRSQWDYSSSAYRRSRSRAHDSKAGPRCL
jgi:hypothetical protein